MFKHKHLYTLVAATLTLTCGALFAQTEASKPALPSQEAPEAEIDITKLSEAFGHFIGKNLKSSGLNLDVKALIQGIQEGNDGKPAPMNDKDYEKGMLALQQKAIKKLSEENLAAANKFLEDNSKKSGIVVLEPGKLQYEILEKGTGAEVPEHGSPKIEYKGTFIDGTVFGSSENTGGAITLPLDQTIPGFAKGIQGMKEGETRRIFVHPDIAYGTSGQMPPNSLLIFEIKVVKADGDKGSDKGAYLGEEGFDSPLAELNPKAAKGSSKSYSQSQSASEDDDEDEDEDDDYDDLDDDYEDDK